MALSPATFALEALKLPATILSGITMLLLGSPKIKNKKNTSLFDIFWENGLLGSFLELIKWLGRSISGLAINHQIEIATAFWTSLIVAAGVGTALFFLPALLATIATLSVYGFSIAGIIGFNPLMQIAFASALAFTATSLAIYIPAALINITFAIVNIFAPEKQPADQLPLRDQEDEEEISESSDVLRNLQTPKSSNKDTQPEEVSHHSPIIQRNPSKKNTPPENTSESQLSSKP